MCTSEKKRNKENIELRQWHLNIHELERQMTKVVHVIAWALNVTGSIHRLVDDNVAYMAC